MKNLSNQIPDGEIYIQLLVLNTKTVLWGGLGGAGLDGGELQLGVWCGWREALQHEKVAWLGRLEWGRADQARAG